MSLDPKLCDGSPNPKDTKFPFGKTKDQANTDLARKRSPVPSALVPYLLSFEPWEGGRHSLYELNEARNGKIHRILDAGAGGSAGIDVKAASGSGAISIEDVGHTPDKDGVITVARIGFSGDGQLRINPAFCVYMPTLFRAGSLFKDATAVLTDYADVVARIVDGVQAEATRLVAELP